MNKKAVRLNDYVHHMREAVDRIQRYTLSKSQLDFTADEQLQDAVVRNVVIDPLPAAEAELRDIDNLPVLGTLLAEHQNEGADYLVTGDKDRLVLAERFPIVTPAEFWKRHGSL